MQEELLKEILAELKKDSKVKEKVTLTREECAELLSFNSSFKPLPSAASSRHLEFVSPVASETVVCVTVELDVTGNVTLVLEQLCRFPSTAETKRLPFELQIIKKYYFSLNCCFLRETPEKTLKQI